jgi:hypothetical protein
LPAARESNANDADTGEPSATITQPVGIAAISRRRKRAAKSSRSVCCARCMAATGGAGALVVGCGLECADLISRHSAFISGVMSACPVRRSEPADAPDRVMVRVLIIIIISLFFGKGDLDQAATLELDSGFWLLDFFFFFVSRPSAGPAVPRQGPECGTRHRKSFGDCS